MVRNKRVFNLPRCKLNTLLCVQALSRGIKCHYIMLNKFRKYNYFPSKQKSPGNFIKEG